MLFGFWLKISKKIYDTYVSHLCYWKKDLPINTLSKLINSATTHLGDILQPIIIQ